MLQNIYIYFKNSGKEKFENYALDFIKIFLHTGFSIYPAPKLQVKQT